MLYGMEVDEIDIEIIEQFNKDGRSSLREIADELGLSPSTVSSRFHKLVEEGAVKRFQPVIDYEKIGYGLTSIIDVNVGAGKKEDVIPELERRTNVVSVYVVTGETDIVLIAKFLNRPDMYNFLKKLQQEEGVQETITKIVLDAPKENGKLDLSRLK